MNRLTAGVFAVLVIATFGAFFVAQRLKNAPPVLSRLTVFPFFSPNRDGRFDVARVSFKVKKTDDVSVAVLNASGDEVRELMGSRRVASSGTGRWPWKRPSWL